MKQVAAALLGFIGVLLPGHSARSDASATPVRPHFAEYTDSTGLVQEGKNPGSPVDAGNGILYTSELEIFLVARHEVTDADRHHFVELIKKVEVPNHPGLINRNPGADKTLEGWDDYIGMVAAAHFLGGEAQEVAAQTLSYGVAHGFIFNNVKPGDPFGPEDNGGPLFARNMAFPAHLFWAARAVPPAHLRALWAASIAKFTGDPSGALLQWLMVRVTPKNLELIAPECALARKQWLKEFSNKYPGGIQDLVGKYMTDKNHPLIAYATDIESEALPITFSGLVLDAIAFAETVVGLTLDATAALELGVEKGVTFTSERLHDETKKLVGGLEELKTKCGTNGVERSIVWGLTTPTVLALRATDKVASGVAKVVVGSVKAATTVTTTVGTAALTTAQLVVDIATPEIKAGDAVVDAGKKVVGGIVDASVDWSKGTKGAAEELAKGRVGAAASKEFKGTVKAFVDIGKPLASGAVSVAKEAPKAAADTGNKILDTAKDTVKKVIQCVPGFKLCGDRCISRLRRC
jgi:hypothetical protein